MKLVWGVGGVEDACSWFSFSFPFMKEHGVVGRGAGGRAAARKPTADNDGTGTP